MDKVDIEIDLETLGKRPGCAILSIGAVYFYPNNPPGKQIGKEFYKVVRIYGQEAAGLHIDPSTVSWWAEQSVEAREVLRQSGFEGDAADPDALLLDDALAMFADFLPKDPDSYRVWACGSEFDIAILDVAHMAIRRHLPWNFWNGHSHRTLKMLAPDIKADRTGTHHNALDDAKTQAEHAIRILNALKIQHKHAPV